MKGLILGLALGSMVVLGCGGDDDGDGYGESTWQSVQDGTRAFRCLVVRGDGDGIAMWCYGMDGGGAP